MAALDRNPTVNTGKSNKTKSAKKPAKSNTSYEGWTDEEVVLDALKREPGESVKPDESNKIGLEDDGSSVTINAAPQPGTTSIVGFGDRITQDTAKLTAGSCAGDEVDKCQTALGEVEHKACDPNGEQITSAKQTINSMSAASQVSGSLGLLEMCQTMNNAMATATLALTAFKSFCTMAIEDCTKVCDSAAAAVSSANVNGVCTEQSKTVSDYKKRCKAATQTAADAVNQANALIPAMNRAKQCAQANSSGQMALKTGEVNCSDANTAKSNPVCICQANPRDPVCSELKNSTGPLNTDQSLVVGVEGSGPDSNQNQNMAGPDYQNLEDFQHDGKQSASSEVGGAKILGGGGGSASGSGGSGGGAGGGGKSGGFLADKLSVLRGFFTGSGGGGGGSSGSSGSGDSYGSRGGNSGFAAKRNQIDLKQFLPGGTKDPSRSLAGIAGPDGITGPNSDIFLKVNTRYQSYWGIMKP